MPSIVKKTFQTALASGNHLLTQAKGNQPGLLRRLEYGARGRKPSGQAGSRTKGRNRLEQRSVSVYPAKAWFKGTPWHGLIKTVLRVERFTQCRSADTGLWRPRSETAYYVSSAETLTPDQWNDAIRRHWHIENANHHVRDVTFGEDASRIRKNPDIFARLRSTACNILRHNGHDNMRQARWIGGLDLNSILEMGGIR